MIFLIETKVKLTKRIFFSNSESGTQRPSFCTNPSLRPTKKLNLLDEFMSLNVEQNLTFMFLNPGLRLISMLYIYSSVCSIPVSHENLSS